MPHLPTLGPGRARLVPVLMLVLLALWPAGTRAQAPAFAWATPCASFSTSVNSTQTSARGPVSVAVDGQGQVYVAGSFTETVQLGSTTLVSQGLSDAFVAKLDANGRYLWAVAVGGPGNDGAGAVAVDALGQVYVTGDFSSFSADFGSQRLFNSSDEAEVFVAALDAQGRWRWARRAGGTGSDGGASLVVEPDGDLLLAGSFSSAAADFGSTSLASVDSRYLDVFVARLSGATGTWRWAVRAGGTAQDWAAKIVSNGAGRAWVSGDYNSVPASFGAASVTTTPLTLPGAQPPNQTFVAQLNTQSGTWDWATSGGVVPGPLASSTLNRGLAYDGFDGLYVVGSFSGPAARFGSHQLTNPGQISYSGPQPLYSSDIYVARLDVDTHTWAWARRMGSNTNDSGMTIVADLQGNVNTAGRFGSSTLSFDNSPLTLTRATSGGAFVAQLDGATGTWQWARGTAAGEAPLINALASAATGELYLAGFFGSRATFGPTVLPPVAGQESSGFVARLGGGPLATRSSQRDPAFALWPNPARSQVWVGGLPPHRPLELRDALGRHLLNATTPASGPLRLLLPPALPAGVYLLLSPGYAPQRLLVE